MSISQHREAGLHPAIKRAAASAQTQLAMFWRAIIRSVWPRAEDAWLVEAQLRLSRRSTRNNTLLMPIAGFLVALGTAPWVARDTRTIWWLAISGVCLVLDFAGRRIEHMPTHTLAQVRKRAVLHTATMCAFLLSWCSMSVFLWVPGEMADHMLLVLILSCSLAGTIAISAMHPASAFVAFVVHSVFIIAPTAISWHGTDATLAELAVLFCILLSGQAVALSSSMMRMLRLEHERSGLVQNMQQAKLESDRERARAVNAGRAKSQFLSNMNHELRTPMNAILGFSELIKTKAFGDSADRYVEYADIIHSSGQHLLALINDMLDLAKIESGKLGLRESDVSLAGCIAEALEAVSAKAAEASIEIEKQVARGLPKVRGDERGLRQIFANLLSNAVRFTPPGGKVTVFARIESDGRIAVGVTDTGIGIAKEDQPHVFERFGKGRHDVTSAEKGTGLGLAIVKGFAEAHEGSVTLESELGIGTRVTVYLPAARALTPPQAARRAG